MDGLVVSVTFGATLLTSILTGVFPALVSSAMASAEALREGSRTLTPGRGQGKLLGSMVVVQFALAFILVDVAVLMLQSLREATTYQELAEPEQVLVAGYLQPQEPKPGLHPPRSLSGGVPPSGSRPCPAWGSRSHDHAPPRGPLDQRSSRRRDRNTIRTPTSLRPT